MRKISLLVLLVSVLASAQDKGAPACETLSKITALIQREHYRPKAIDDSLSVYVFDTFLDGLDSYRNLFTDSDYAKLSRHRLTIDNHIIADDCAFLDEFTSIYKHALVRKKDVLEKIRNTPLDYNSSDTVKFSRDRFPFDMGDDELERVWKKRIRIEVLEEISKMSTNLDSLKINFTSIEKDIKAKTFEANLCRVNSILEDMNGTDIVLLNDFLNIFCGYFDPHSNYFTVDAKSSFISMLSTSNLSLGLNFALNDKEEIIVAEIIPGGPAAKTEKFEKEDVIVKVADTQGRGYMVSCASLDAVGDMIYSDSNQEIKLTVRKKNGLLLDVSLKKQIMEATTNNVYSFIAENNSKVGYIKIPNFYSDFDGYNIQGCAEDVAREIVKLKKDNIEGLVIDLQDNGGGSMEEAMKLAGMFVDYGPVSVLSDSNNKQLILKDINRGSSYNGPIVLLINGGSASASEFFASAMQDYKRAFVVGAASSGKATMQSILPLDEGNEKDFVKLTLEKFYRITGDSNQIKGVVPDVGMPALFDSIVPREKSYKTALKYDVIQTKTRWQEYPSANNNKVIDLSTDRVKNNQYLNEIAKLNIEINNYYKNPKSPIRLLLEDFFKDNHSYDDFWKKIKTLSEKPNNCTISNTSYEKEKLLSDTFQQEINDYRIKDLKTNPYLDEAVNIIKDYNTLKIK